MLNLVLIQALLLIAVKMLTYSLDLLSMEIILTSSLQMLQRIMRLTIAIAYIDVHANSFGAEGTHDPTFTAVHHADRPTTGFYFPTNEIVGVIGGAYKANITASGLEAVAVYSDGVELQANDSATLFSAYANDYATHTQITANVDIVQDNVAQNATDISAVEARRQLILLVLYQLLLQAT
jgi:hypothetical protein